jgi:hypothetical protein
VKEWEIFGVDAVTDMWRWIQESKNLSRPNLSEAIEEDKLEFASFLEAALGFDIDENDLIVGNTYVPMQISVEYPFKALRSLLAIKPVVYLGKSGGRFVFRYDENAASIFIPSEDALPTDWYKFIFANKNQLDQVLLIMSLRFNGTEWNLMYRGWDDKGVCRPLIGL